MNETDATDREIRQMKDTMRTLLDDGVCPWCHRDIEVSFDEDDYQTQYYCSWCQFNVKRRGNFADD